MNEMPDQLENLDSEGLSNRIKGNSLTESDQKLLLFIVRIAPAFIRALNKSKIHIAKLKALIWGKKSESSRNILDEIDREEASGTDSASADASEANASSKEDQDSHTDSNPTTTEDDTSPTEKPGKYKEDRENGRNGVKSYPNAETETIHHSDLKSGDTCPKCERGKLYRFSPGKFLVFIVEG